jgi:hypothetical protein
MVIESRTIFGAAAAFALVGAALWVSTLLFPAEQNNGGQVEVVQVPERSWTVEIKDLGSSEVPADATRTAANR